MAAEVREATAAVAALGHPTLGRSSRANGGARQSGLGSAGSLSAALLSHSRQMLSPSGRSERISNGVTKKRWQAVRMAVSLTDAARCQRGCSTSLMALPCGNGCRAQTTWPKDGSMSRNVNLRVAPGIGERRGFASAMPRSLRAEAETVPSAACR